MISEGRHGGSRGLHRITIRTGTLARSIAALAVLVCIASSAGVAHAQASRILRQLVEAEAAKVLESAGAELVLGENLHYHVFGAEKKTFFYDELRRTLFEFRDGSVNDALEECRTAKGRRAEDLLTDPTINTGIYPSAAESPFLSRTKLDGTKFVEFFAVRNRARAKLEEVVSSTGQAARVTAVPGHDNILHRASSHLSGKQLVQKLAAEPLTPSDIHVIAYYRDTHIEQRLHAIHGIKLTIIPPDQPQQILDAIRAAHAHDLLFILAHNENGMFQIPGVPTQGISGDEVVATIKREGRRGFVWGCESGVDFSAASGPRKVVDIDEAVDRLVVAVKKDNLLEFTNAMKDQVVLDETILRRPPVPWGGSFAESKAAFIRGLDRNPALILPPRRSVTIPTGRTQSATAASHAAGPSDATPTERPNGGTTSPIDAGHRNDERKSTDEVQAQHASNGKTIFVIAVGLLGGLALFVFARRR